MCSETSMINTLFVTPLVVSTVTVVGWFVVYFLAKRKAKKESDRTFVEKQIKELYGPLMGMLEYRKYIVECSNIQLGLDKNKNLDIKKDINEGNERSWRHIQGAFLTKQNTDIRILIRSNFHLLCESEMKNCYRIFLEHEAYSDLLYSLSREGIEIREITSVGWPESFYNIVEEELNKLKAEYVRLS